MDPLEQAVTNLISKMASEVRVKGRELPDQVQRAGKIIRMVFRRIGILAVLRRQWQAGRWPQYIDLVEAGSETPNTQASRWAFIDNKRPE
jgi:hypothetical protein